LFLLRERGFEPREGGIQDGGKFSEFASASATLMRCDKSPAEIFTAAALIFSIGRIARETNHQPPARPTNKNQTAIAVKFRAARSSSFISGAMEAPT